MTIFPIQRANLAQLFWLRCLAITGQLVTIAVVQGWLGVNLPVAPMLAIVAMEVLFNVMTWVRVRMTRRARALLGHDASHGNTNVELAGQLLVDIGALTALLFFSGGTTNPFVSLYLPGLAIAAAVLPWRHALPLAILSLLCYGLLSFGYVPLRLDHPDEFFRLHQAGMWINFIISVALIAWFVSRMSRALRERDALLAQAEQRLLRDERMAALGAQAASVAHELGTPLSTMAVVVGELRHALRGAARTSKLGATLAPELEVLEQQIALCKHAIGHVQARAAAPVRQALTVWLPAFIEQWRLRHPQVTFSLAMPDDLSASIDDTVQTGQILTILLDNAALVSPHDVQLTCQVDAGAVTFIVCDHGPGLPPRVRDQLGVAPVVSTHGGHGMGLYLAFASTERLGGTLNLNDHVPHGTCATLCLPFDGTRAPGMALTSTALV